MITKEEKFKSDLPVITTKLKFIGLIKVTRPQFLFAYLVYSVVTLSFGAYLNKSPINGSLALLSISVVLVSASGVHFRDEAADWNNGFDKDHGGMGVVRDGIYRPEKLTRLGILINLVGLIIGTYNTLLYPLLLVVGIPMLVIIAFCNYLTEEVLLGHELVTGFTYLATILWVYIGQGWVMSLPIFLFALFGYIIVLALIPYQDIGDIEVDKSTGKKTLTVKLGIEPITNLSIITALIAMLVLAGVFLTIPP
ncbi:MAG: UbiA family prenyltransferase [Candidatus Hodarchaeales archaeon]|jgi:1,4-dihydroxy-2-naphthoate octaprenyltransferase